MQEIMAGQIQIMSAYLMHVGIEGHTQECNE